MIPTAQIETIFWDPGHWMNNELAERFGAIDEDGLRIYNPTKAEMREHLEILLAESLSDRHAVKSQEV